MANRNIRRKPPPKWEQRPRETNHKTIYSIKNGKVIGVSIDNIQSMKKSVSDVTRGTFYAISTSDTILKKIANSQQQNKIWYYNKQEFPPRPISVPDNNGPNYKLYTIVKPTNEQTVILDEAFTKTPSLVREETAPNPDDLLPKQSSPQLPSSQLNNEPEQIAEILKSQEPELPLTDQPKTIKAASMSNSTLSPFLPPISPTKSIRTLESINKSFKKYRF